MPFTRTPAPFNGGTITNQLTITVPGGGNDDLNVQGEGNIRISGNRFSNDAVSPVFRSLKARGTIAVPLVILQNDLIFQFNGLGYGGTAFRNSYIEQVSVVAATPSDTDMQSRGQFFFAPAASIVPTEVMRLEAAVGLSMFGANPVIDQNRVFRLRNFTVGTLPAANLATGQMTFVTDATLTAITGLGLAVTGGGANKVIVYSDSTNWIIV